MRAMDKHRVNVDHRRRRGDERTIRGSRSGLQLHGEVHAEEDDFGTCPAHSAHVHSDPRRARVV